MNVIVSAGERERRDLLEPFQTLIEKDASNPFCAGLVARIKHAVEGIFPVECLFPFGDDLDSEYERLNLQNRCKAIGAFLEPLILEENQKEALADSRRPDIKIVSQLVEDKLITEKELSEILEGTFKKICPLRNLCRKAADLFIQISKQPWFQKSNYRGCDILLGHLLRQNDMNSIMHVFLKTMSIEEREKAIFCMFINDRELKEDNRADFLQKILDDEEINPNEGVRWLWYLNSHTELSEALVVRLVYNGAVADKLQADLDRRLNAVLTVLVNVNIYRELRAPVDAWKKAAAKASEIRNRVKENIIFKHAQAIMDSVPSLHDDVCRIIRDYSKPTRREIVENCYAL